MEFSIKRVLIIGLGMIGGSFASALKARDLVDEIVAYDANPAECETGRLMGIIDRVAEDLEAEVKAADLVMLGVPVKVMETVLAQIAPWIDDNTLLTDVGSTKGNLVAAARRIFNPLPKGFVPGHPIAGIEKSGVAVSSKDMFLRKKVILTPLPESSPEAALALARLWQGAGSEVLQMDVQRHDEVLAATSHLPHLLAFSLVDTLAKEEKNTDIFRYAAGGFRDFTRIAGSDPTMWHDICFANRDQLLMQIDRFVAGVGELRQAIETGNSETMLGIFTRAKASREQFSRILARASYMPDGHHDNWTLTISPTELLKGIPDITGDRSISHRTILLAALSEGVTDIDGFFEAEDSLATLQALRDMGVVIEGPHQGRVRVYGVGLTGLRKPVGPLYCGRSSTSMRLLMGVLAAQDFESELVGDDVLNTLDMQPVIDALTLLGADIQAESGKAPIKITPASLSIPAQPIEVTSAQVKSALIFAGLYIDSPLTLSTPVTSRDHTERLLSALGCVFESDAKTLRVLPHPVLKAQPVHVPADITNAAFFILAATVAKQADVTLQRVGVNATRMGVIQILQRMGADIEFASQTVESGEPLATLNIRSAALNAIDLNEPVSLALLDEMPVLLMAMAHAQGTSTVCLPVEIDPVRKARLEGMIAGLQAAGIDVVLSGQQLQVKGARLQGAVIDGQQDYQIVLSFAAAASAAEGDIRITNAGAVAIYYPEFVEQARRIGFKILKETD